MTALALFYPALKLSVSHEWRCRDRNAEAQLAGWTGLRLAEAPRNPQIVKALPLQRLLHRLGTATGAREVYRRALQGVVELSGARSALLVGHLGERGTFRVLAQHDVPPELLRSLHRFTLKPGNVFYELATHERLFWLSEVTEGQAPELLPPPLLRGLLDQQGDVLLMPLHHQGELTALLALAAPGAGRPGPAVMATLGGLRAPLAQALHHAQLMYALERSEVQAQATLAALQEGVIRMDPSGTILQANAAAYRLLGLAPGKLERHSLLGDAWEAYSPDGRRMKPCEYPGALALQQGRSVNGHLMRVHLNGRTLWLSVNAAPLTDQDEVTGVVLSFADVTEAHELRLRLEHQAMHDPLTGLPGRRAFEQALQQEGAGAVVLIDLDGFREVNSAHGLHVGDEVLRQVATRLTARGQDTVARLAADEFGVVLPGADLAAAQAFAARLQAELQRPFALPGGQGAVVLTVCAGLCANPDASGQERYRNASLALGAAKASGPGQLRVFWPELLLVHQRRARVHQRLTQALDIQGDPGLHLHFQPIVGPPGSAPHLEALARWHDPELGAVGPHEFVPVAEATGLMPRLGEAVLHMALRAVVDWSERLGTAVEVSVNVSASQLALPDFGRQVRSALARSGAGARQLTLEVTEAVLMQDTERVARCLQALRDTGVCVALDDFGTGFSSLSLLHQLPIDTIKVDRSFVQNVHEHPRRQVLLSAVAAVGRELGTEVVAEGVETPEELRTLCTLGYRRFQGYLFARPQPPEHALAALETARGRVRELTPQPLLH